MQGRKREKEEEEEQREGKERTGEAMGYLDCAALQRRPEDTVR